MADYQADIRLGVQGLGQLGQLERRLERAVELLGRLEQTSFNIDQAAESSSRNLNRAARRRDYAVRDLRSAYNTVQNVAQRRDLSTGRFVAGGPNATARRLALKSWRLAQREDRESERNLREEAQNRALIRRAQRRYASALDRAGNIIGGVQSGIGEAQARVDDAMRRIGRESRENYLTNLFRGRQREFARGGGGAELPPALQQQARNTRAAFDLALAARNPALMQRLGTEQAGLLREQNERNRLRSGRSIAFESARRAQERIDELAARPGVDDARIRGLRSQTERVIAASRRGDTAGSKDLTRRMNAAIARYTRELDSAARELSGRQRAGVRNLNVRQGWQRALADMADWQRTNRRALPSSAMLAERVAGTPGGVAPVDLLAQRRERERRAAEELARSRTAGPRSPIGGADFMAGSPAYVAKAGKNLEAAAKVARSVDAAATASEIALDEKVFQNKLSKYNELARQELKLIKANDKAELQDFDRRLANRERVKKERQNSRLFQGSRRDAISQGIVGGAFPLLFGQGATASALGGLGGFAGGMLGGSFGFGLSLIGTALGQVVDTTVGKLGDLGGALGSASEAITAMEKAGLRVRDSQKIQIDQLEKVGRGYEAQQQMLKEIESRLGPGSVAQIEKLNSAQKELSDSWAVLSLQLGTTFIPVVIAAANAISDLFGVFQQKSGGGNPTTAKPRKPSDVIADIDALIALNERNRAGNREYASLVRDVEDWRRDNEDKIFAMRRQGMDIEKQKSDLRLDVENRIFQMRQDGARLEVNNARSRAQLAIESFDLDLARRSDAIGGAGGNFVDQIREYLRSRGQGEAELRAKEKTTKLEIAASERELQQYILQVSDKVASIARAVEDYKRDQAKFRFESSKRLEDYRIKTEDYIYGRFKERYEYAIGSEQEILRIKMQAATAMGAALPPDATKVLGGTAGGAGTSIGVGGLANPLGPQRSGRPPNWNQGLGAGRGHQGQDIGVDVGTTIHAMEDAVVEGIIRGFSRNGNPRAGDAVMLRYLSGQLGVYGHVRPGSDIAPGQRVKAGQRIGVVSDWGDNTHLHYELWKRSRGAGGQLLDPTERLRSAMSGRRVRPPMPATPSQRRSGPAMLVPGVMGPALQPSVPATTDSMFDRRSSLPGGFNVSKLQRNFGEFAGPVQILVTPFAAGTPPMAVPGAPAIPELPPAPAPMTLPETETLTRELGKQREELLMSVELSKKMQDVENGRLLLQLTSTREVRDRLDDAARELGMEKELLGVDRSRSQSEQERSAEKIRARLATEELNKLEKQGVGLADDLLRAGKLQQQEYDQITSGIRSRIGYEKELLQIMEDKAEVARQEAFNQRSGELMRDAALTGAGLRAGFIGPSARAFEQEMAISGDSGQAGRMANLAKTLENQQLVWDNLEKNIVDVSTAISGSLTNGLVDIVSSSKKIEDVGREMLNNIARSFADSAAQQLNALLQRQLMGLMGGMLGGGGGGGAGVLGSFFGGPALVQGLGQSIPFGGFFASGGTTRPGKGYVVGDGGEPEFFFPGVTGRVVPKSDMEKAAELRGRGEGYEPIKLHYTVKEERGERYVTEDQMRKSNAATLKRAQAMTLSGMRNNKEVRDYVGM